MELLNNSHSSQQRDSGDDSMTLCQRFPELLAMLDELPLLNFHLSAVATRNLCRRFKIEKGTLYSLWNEFHSQHCRQKLKGKKRRQAELIALLSVPSFDAQVARRGEYLSRHARRVKWFKKSQ